MAYFKRRLERAFADTLKPLGWNWSSAALGALTIIVTILLYLAFASKDDAMVEAKDILFGLIAAITVGGVFFIFNYLAAPSRMQAEADGHIGALTGRLKKLTDKQGHVDHLSDLLSDAIRDIWNAFPENDAEMEAVEARWHQWRTEVENYLRDHFTKSDLMHFSRLGVVPLVQRGGEYNETHNKMLREYALKETRMREIIRDHNITHVG